MGRVVGPAELDSELSAAREEGRRIVLTSGAFDLLHPGHLWYLREAAALGELLVVGVSSDGAVARLEGAGRPFVGEADRADLVAALDPVDVVTIYDEARASDLIRRVRPDFYVKAGDFDPATLPEAPAVGEVGAQLRLVPYMPAYTTDDLLARIRATP